ADTSRLRTIIPIHPAKTAMIKPTTINGGKPLKNAFIQVKLATTFNQIVPNVNVMNIPIMLAIIAFIIVKLVVTKYLPIKYTVGMKQIINLPVGSNNIRNHPVICEKTRNQMVTIIISKIED